MIAARWKMMYLLTGITVLVSSFALFYSNRIGFSSLKFVTYENLGEGKISSRELNQVVGLHQECFEGERRKNLLNYYLKVKHPHSDDYFRAYLKEKVDENIQQSRLGKNRIFRAKRNITLLKKGEEIIGMYTCVPEQVITHGSVMIYDVCLAQNLRGKGLGKTLMEHAIERCREPGKDLTLTVYKDSTAAIGLYTKLHFVTVPMPPEAGDAFDYFNKNLMIYQPSP